jgi:hypothetical protein
MTALPIYVLKHKQVMFQLTPEKKQFRFRMDIIYILNGIFNSSIRSATEVNISEASGVFLIQKEDTHLLCPHMQKQNCSCTRNQSCFVHFLYSGYLTLYSGCPCRLSPLQPASLLCDGVKEKTAQRNPQIIFSGALLERPILDYLY